MPPGEHVSFIIQPVFIQINQILQLNHFTNCKNNINLKFTDQGSRDQGKPAALGNKAKKSIHKLLHFNF